MDKRRKEMKLLPVMVLILCVCLQARATDVSIAPGQNIGPVTNALMKAGYKETGLDMMTFSKDRQLSFWSIGDGVLILTYATKNGNVTGMTYYFCDERPKAKRKTFELEVAELNLSTKEMRVKLPNKTSEPSSQSSQVQR
jgi:hypothetical protein